MSLPDYQTLMAPVLRLTAEGHERVPDMLPVIAREFALDTEAMGEVLPSGRTSVIASRLHWARTYLSKAGLVAPIRRGAFQVTDRGRAVLASHPGPIDIAFLEQFGDFVAWRERSRVRGSRQGGAAIVVVEPKPDVARTPEERIAGAVAELESLLADDLLGRLLEGSPAFFERAVVDLLVAMGYGRGRDGAGRLLGRSGDGGLDGVIKEDKLGLDAIYVQAKRYARDNSVGRPAIQQFVGSLTGEGAQKGVFVTTSSFTADARRYVDRVSQRLILIDGDDLTRLMIAHGVGVRTIRTVDVRQIDENFFDDA